MKKFLKYNKILSYYCLLSLVCVCYVYKNIYGEEQPKKLLFKAYLAQEEWTLPMFSYKRFMEYLRGCKKEDYVDLAQKAIQSCSNSMIA